jgi:diacylglycerol kinase family enzyme
VRVLLVHNPKAGDEGHSRERLEALVSEEGHDVTYRSIKEHGWNGALADAPDLVAVAGGDGSVCEVFLALAGHPTPATILPLGSSNNIARTLGVAADDPRDLIAGWPSARRRAYDIWAVRGLDESRFLESMGGGIFADVVARAKNVDDDSLDKVELGLKLLADVIDEAVEQAWELTLDGNTSTERVLAFEAMNVRELGPNLPLAPEAEPGDGRLDVVLIHPEHRSALAAYVEARARGASGER